MLFSMRRFVLPSQNHADLCQHRSVHCFTCSQLTDGIAKGFLVFEGVLHQFLMVILAKQLYIDEFCNFFILIVSSVVAGFICNTEGGLYQGCEQAWSLENTMYITLLYTNKILKRFSRRLKFQKKKKKQLNNLAQIVGKTSYIIQL